MFGYSVQYILDWSLFPLKGIIIHCSQIYKSDLHGPTHHNEDLTKRKNEHVNKSSYKIIIQSFKTVEIL